MRRRLRDSGSFASGRAISRRPSTWSPTAPSSRPSRPTRPCSPGFSATTTCSITPATCRSSSTTPRLRGSSRSQSADGSWSKPREVAHPHHRCLAARCGQGFEVGVVAHASGGDDEDVTATRLFVEREVWSPHRAVAIDRGDVNARHARTCTTRQRVGEGESGTFSPPSHGDLPIAHVEGRDELVAEGADKLIQRGIVGPECRAHNHALRARVEGGPSTVQGSNAPRYLKGSAVGGAPASLDHFRSQCSVTSSLKIDDVDEGWTGRHDTRHELLQRLAKENAVVVALFKAHGLVTQDVEGGDELHSSELAY